MIQFLSSCRTQPLHLFLPSMVAGPKGIASPPGSRAPIFLPFQTAWELCGHVTRACACVCPLPGTFLRPEPPPAPECWCMYECVGWEWEWGWRWGGEQSWVRGPLHCASAAVNLHAGRVGRLQSSTPGDRHSEGFSALDCRPFPVLTVSGAATVEACLHVPKTHSRRGKRPEPSRALASVRLLARTARGSVEEGRPGRSPEPPQGYKF